MHCSILPHHNLCYHTPHTHTHYLGYIMRVVGYGQGHAFSMFGGAMHPEIGCQNGVLCTHLEFPMCWSHKPGLWIYYIYQYEHVWTTLTSHVQAVVHPQHVQPDDTTTHTPLHSPLHSTFQHQILAGTQSPNKYNPPANKQNRQ